LTPQLITVGTITVQTTIVNVVQGCFVCDGSSYWYQLY